MDHGNYFRELIDSILDYRKIVFLIFLFQIDKDILREIIFSELDINPNLQFEKISIDQHELYIDYVKNAE